MLPKWRKNVMFIGEALMKKALKTTFGIFIFTMAKSIKKSISRSIIKLSAIRSLFLFITCVASCVTSLFLMATLIGCSDDDDGTSTVITYSALKDKDKMEDSTSYRLAKVDKITFYDDQTFQYLVGTVDLDQSDGDDSTITRTIEVAQDSNNFKGVYTDGCLKLSKRAGEDSVLQLNIRDVDTFDRSVEFHVVRDDTGEELTVTAGEDRLSAVVTIPQDATNSLDPGITYTISANCINNDRFTHALKIKDMTLYVVAAGGVQYSTHDRIFKGTYIGNPKESGEVTLTGRWRENRSSDWVLLNQTVTIKGNRLIMKKTSEITGDSAEDKEITLCKNGKATFVISFDLNGGYKKGSTPENSKIANIELENERSTTLPNDILYKDGETFCGWVKSNENNDARSDIDYDIDNLLLPGDRYTLNSNDDETLIAVFTKSFDLKVTTPAGTVSTLTTAEAKKFSYIQKGTYTFTGTLGTEEFNALMKASKTAADLITLDFSGCTGSPINPSNGTKSYTLCGITSYGETNDYLQNVVLPPNLFIVPSYAFYSCSELVHVTLGNSNTVVYDGAYDNCPKFEKL